MIAQNLFWFFQGGWLLSMGWWLISRKNGNHNSQEIATALEAFMVGGMTACLVLQLFGI